MGKTGLPGTWLSRLAWFVALWAAGVASLAVVAFALRLLFRPGVHP